MLELGLILFVAGMVAGAALLVAFLELVRGEIQNSKEKQ
jgi:hypothetical protein